MKKKYKLSKQEGGTNKFKIDCPDYPYINTIINPKNKRGEDRRIIAIGDIHGDYNLTINLLLLAKVIEISNSQDSIKNKISWIGADTIVVQIGDQIDSCRPYNNLKCNMKETTKNDKPDDIKILKLFTELDKQARKQDGMVISLLGNHEVMNALGQLQYTSYENIKDAGSYEERFKLFSSGGEIGKFLGCTRQAAVIIGDNLFVHAGIVNGLIKELELNSVTDLEDINFKVRKWLLGKLDKKEISKIIDSSNYGMLWTRILGNILPDTKMEEPICVNNIHKVLELFNIKNMIIGHTPQSFLYTEGINSTCSNRIWRIDNGSADAFNKFDQFYNDNGNKVESRNPQVLEIIGDVFKIIK